jgi:CRISPR-associated endonuclease/helicase Cas3
VYKAYEYLIKNIQADQFEILIQRTSDLVKRINNLSKNYYANESIEKHIDWNIDQAQELKENFEYQFKSKYFPEFKHYTNTDSIDVLRDKVRINRT